MSAARIDSAGTVKLLDGKAEPEEVITVADVQEPTKLVRLLARLLAIVATLKRQFVPRRIDFEDLAVTTSATLVSVEHGFGGRVRWWVCDCTTAVRPYRDTSKTTSNTLAIQIVGDVAGTFCLRVEEAG